MENEKTTVTTSSGYTCEVDADALDDVEVLDAIVDLYSGNALQQLKAVRLILTAMLCEAGYNDLVQFLKERDGKARYSALNAEMTEIMTTLNESKKK